DAPNSEEWFAYQKHIPWRLKKLFAQGLATLQVLREGPQRDFARCSLLVTGQWALDCKTAIPSKDDLLEQHRVELAAMLAGGNEFCARVKATFAAASQLNTRRALM